MPYCGALREKKLKFQGKQDLKKQTKSSEFTSSVGVNEIESAETIETVDDAEDTILQSATPTCSERKLYNFVLSAIQ